MFKYLDNIGNNYSINTKKFFSNETITIIPSGLKKIFNFAYDMTFGGKGEHRDHRSGGETKRRNGEIFINVFQGKLAECGVYKFFRQNNIKLPSPDFKLYDLGKWDSCDFNYKNMNISVKSTTYFGNLMLLETKDWDTNGCYIPNSLKYDYHILVRIKPDGKRLMKSKKLFFSDFCDKDALEKIIFNEKWEIEVTGYITNDDLKYLINNNYILPQGAILNEATKMDAENYYVQAGNLREINNILTDLKKL